MEKQLDPDPRQTAGRWLKGLVLASALFGSTSLAQPAVPEVPVVASWYGPGFHGRLTANGEVYNQYELTAAHKSLPFGTRVRVTNLKNDRQVIVRINDRGPFIEGREIDLSYQAAAALGMVDDGLGRVKLEVLP